jgi:ribosomal protein L15
MAMQRTLSRPARWSGFEKGRKMWGLDANLEMKAAFPLLHAGNLTARMHRNPFDYRGRKEFDEDHPLPVLGSRSSTLSDAHEWEQWDKSLNPQLIADFSSLPQTVDYVGRRSGRLFPGVGWRAPGSSWKFTLSYDRKVRKWRPGVWAEKFMTPKWALVPRIAALHPDERFQGKLQFVDLKLSHIVWAIDTDRLNRNEVLTLNILVDAGVLPQTDVVWPGVNLVYDLTADLKYPINIELQNADPEAIAAIERAGGTFTGTYMSIDGLYQEMRPEEYPVFLDQHMPDRPGFTHLSSNPRVRGFLSQWYEEEGKYAHKDAARRLSHYRRPPHRRDFPSTYEEYEQVKHHQKWHLNQSGTGTVLPFVRSNSLEDARPGNQQLTDPALR